MAVQVVCYIEKIMPTTVVAYNDKYTVSVLKYLKKHILW